MVYDLPKSDGNNELKDTLSQLDAAIRGSESKAVTDWIHNGSVQNSNQNKPNVAETDPHARALVELTAMVTSLSVNPEDRNTNEALFGELLCEITPSLQQQLNSDGINRSIPVVTSGQD